jgi:hypothetical protein
LAAPAAQLVEYLLLVPVHRNERAPVSRRTPDGGEKAGAHHPFFLFQLRIALMSLLAGPESS